MIGQFKQIESLRKTLGVLDKVNAQKHDISVEICVLTYIYQNSLSADIRIIKDGSKFFEIPIMTGSNNIGLKTVPVKDSLAIFISSPTIEMPFIIPIGSAILDTDMFEGEVKIESHFSSLKQNIFGELDFSNGISKTVIGNSLNMCLSENLNIELDNLSIKTKDSKNGTILILKLFGPHIEPQIDETIEDILGDIDTVLNSIDIMLNVIKEGRTSNIEFKNFLPIDMDKKYNISKCRKSIMTIIIGKHVNKKDSTSRLMTIYSNGDIPVDDYIGMPVKNTEKGLSKSCKVSIIRKYWTCLKNKLLERKQMILGLIKKGSL